MNIYVPGQRVVMSDDRTYQSLGPNEYGDLELDTWGNRSLDLYPIWMYIPESDPRQALFYINDRFTGTNATLTLDTQGEAVLAVTGGSRVAGRYNLIARANINDKIGTYVAGVLTFTNGSSPMLFRLVNCAAREVTESGIATSYLYFMFVLNGYKLDGDTFVQDDTQDIMMNGERQNITQEVI